LFERTGTAARLAAVPYFWKLPLPWEWPGIKARHVAVSGLLLCAGMTPVPADEIPRGAASCSGCHAAEPNVDTPVPRLAGQDVGAMVAAMQAYRSGQRMATVMDRIAKGFSDDEIKAIAAWFGAQQP
jgi:sulfide dehydrogenase cytochrome subunit